VLRLAIAFLGADTLGADAIALCAGAVALCADVVVFGAAKIMTCDKEVDFGCQIGGDA